MKEDLAIKALFQSMSAELVNNTNLYSAKGVSVLWCADEHPVDRAIWRCLDDDRMASSVSFLTNRFDQYRQALAGKLCAQYSDFDFSRQPKEKIQQVFIRIPKERALVHHLINQAYMLLPEYGKLWLFGYKTEGIKTHISRAASLFSGELNQSKGKNQLFCASIEKVNRALDKRDIGFLDDQSYSEIRQVGEGKDAFWSKPGLYGWNKVDQGSHFLLEVLQSQSIDFTGKTILDLGCGYGYLSMFAAHRQAKKVISTDNCAAALNVVEKNMQELRAVLGGVDSEVVASDAADQIEAPIDIVLCNPPFHQGFSMSTELHDRFLANTRRLLQLKKATASNGARHAWFVVNQFLSLDEACRRQRLHSEEVAKNKSYKVLRIAI